MNEERFDGLLRVLGSDLTRRGAIAALCGFGLSALPNAALAKKRRRQKRTHVARKPLSAESAQADSFVQFGESDAERIAVLAFYDSWPLWDHPDLTASVKAVGSADPAMVAVTREAIALWGQALDSHFDGTVTLTDVTDNADEAKRADIHVRLGHQRGGSDWTGIAICGDDECKKILVKTEFPPGVEHWPDPFTGPQEFSVEFVGQATVHELGHALGLGHASPRDTTDDIMGYGFLSWFNPEPVVLTPFVSTCDLKALDAIFAWQAEGTAPRRPTVPEIVC
jgi:hypothetical protein